jgi:hypothetical protein
MAEDGGTLLLDARPAYSLWQQRCQHGELFTVQAEGGHLTDEVLADGFGRLLTAMPAAAEFVTLYDLTAGLTGFVSCGPALLRSAMEMRAACAGKQRAVIIVSPLEDIRAWAHCLLDMIPRDGIEAYVVCTLERAWDILDQPTLPSAAAEASGGGPREPSEERVSPKVCR